MFQTRQRLIVAVATLLFMAQPTFADWADDVHQINSLAQQGKYQEAERFASESLARGPGGLLFSGTGTLIIRHQRASIRLVLGDTTGAIADADVIVRENSDLLTADAGYAIRVLAKAATGDAAGAQAEFLAGAEVVKTGPTSMFGPSTAFRQNFLIESRAVANLLLDHLDQADADLAQIVAADFDTSLAMLIEMVETKKQSWKKTRATIARLREGDLNAARELARSALQVLYEGKETKNGAGYSTAKLVLDKIERKASERVALAEEGLLLQAQQQLSAGNRRAAFDTFVRAYAELSPGAAQDKAFLGLALIYPTLPEKPGLPEAARRFLVQARGVVEDKDYSRAVGLYDKGIRLAPWWAPSHYDRGLLLGLVGRYVEATESMQRHLQLAPAAESARAAQDKIYEWEVKIDTEQGSAGRMRQRGH